MRKFLTGFMKKSVVAVMALAILSVNMLPGFGTLTARAQGLQPPVWDGSSVTPWTVGDGSSGNPYQISTGAQLAYLSEQINDATTNPNYSGAYFKLMNDIDLGGHKWTPIGWESSDVGITTNFNGYFDGDNHVIVGVQYILDS